MVSGWVWVGGVVDGEFAGFGCVVVSGGAGPGEGVVGVAGGGPAGVVFGVVVAGAEALQVAGFGGSAGLVGV